MPFNLSLCSMHELYCLQTATSNAGTGPYCKCTSPSADAGTVSCLPGVWSQQVVLAVVRHGVPQQAACCPSRFCGTLAPAARTALTTCKLSKACLYAFGAGYFHCSTGVKCCGVAAAMDICQKDVA
jgi:hypothetical protein